MRRLILFLPMLAATAALAKDVAIDPFRPSLASAAPGFVNDSSDPRDAAAADALRSEPKRPVPELAKRSPEARYTIIARTVLTNDGRILHVFEDASAPIPTNAFGDAFSGVEEVTVLTCREVDL